MARMDTAPPPPMGHNGFSFETRDDLPDYVKRNFHFFKCDADALLRDILKMPLKERGLYMTAILLMYRDLESLPADDKAAAMALHIHVNQYRELKPKLLKPGLLYAKPSGRISNARWEREITDFVVKHRSYSDAAAKREATKKAKATVADPPPIPRGVSGGVTQGVTPGVTQGVCQGVTPGHNSKKDNEINEAVAQLKQSATTKGGKNLEKIEKKEEIEKKESHPHPSESSAARVKRSADDAKALSERLMTVAGSALASAANAAGLLNLSPIMAWLEAGADPEADIVPAVQRVAAAARAKGMQSIRSWEYFNTAVAEAKARREVGLPKVEVSSGVNPPGLKPTQPGFVSAKGWVRL